MSIRVGGGAQGQGDPPVTDDQEIARALRDPDRIAALRRAAPVDSIPEEALDRLTRLAVRSLRIPRAVVLLVDEAHYTVLSHVGLPEPWATERRAPLSHSYCQYAVATRQSLLVADARQEPRLCTSPALLELEDVAYAGVPLFADGYAIGTMCVTESRPHIWTPEEIETLDDLAAAAGRLIELRTQARPDASKRARSIPAPPQPPETPRTELDAVMGAFPGAVLICGATGRLTRVNASAAALFGLTLDRPLPTIQQVGAAHRLFSPGGVPLRPSQHPLAQALRGDARSDFPCMTRRRGTGEEVQLLVSFAPLRGALGEIVGAVAVAGDVSEMFRLEREKDEFLTIASHELKTPLTSLKIQTQLMLRELERTGSGAAYNLERMDRAIRRMEQLVSDLLESARIHAGKLTLRMEVCDLRTLCTEGAEEQMADSGRPVSLHLPVEPMRVVADATRVQQVIANLVSNALKYSPSDGEVSLRLRQEGNQAVVLVSDSGQGIPTEALSHVFERFYRVPGVDVQSGSGVGLGLGLYISQEIIERHGGHMWAESHVGQGSRFSFALPLAVPAG